MDHGEACTGIDGLDRTSVRDSRDVALNNDLQFLHMRIGLISETQKLDFGVCHEASFTRVKPCLRNSCTSGKLRLSRDRLAGASRAENAC